MSLTPLAELIAQAPQGLQITDDDIKAGKPKDPEACPIALAIKRQFPNVEFVSVHNGHVSYRLANDTREYSTMLRGTVKATVGRYDETGEMKPFGLTIGRGFPIAGEVETPKTRP